MKKISSGVWKISFIKTIPVLFSYLFIGIAYGILMEEAGFKWYYALFASTAIYTGAFQFVLTTLMASGASLITVALTAMLINSRQSFYSLSFIDAFRAMGKRKLYMIHTMTDESFALNCIVSGEKDKSDIMFLMAIFCKAYWIGGTLLGSIAGQLIPWDTTGIDYCMTALFITIFIDQWEKAEKHTPALIGIGVALICLFIFGGTSFMLPALLITSGILVLAGRKEAGV